MLNDAALLHHRHDDHGDPRQIHGDCCARVQLGGIAPNDCEYCEVPFPCPASLALAADRADDATELERYARMAAERDAEDMAVTAALRQRTAELALPDAEHLHRPADGRSADAASRLRMILVDREVQDQDRKRQEQQ